MNNQLFYDKFLRCECRLPPLLSLPLNRTPTYTCSLTPFQTLFFLLGGIVSSCLHTKNSAQDSICLQVLGRYETQRPANTPLSALQFLPLCQHHILSTLKTIRLVQSRKRDIRKKKYCRPGNIQNRKLIIY